MSGQSEESGEAERIRCWICPAKFFDNEQQYHDHTEKVHQGFRYRCEECPNETLFREITDARNHVDELHDVHLQECPLCQATFNYFNLRKHLKEEHGEVRQYKCDLCEGGKSYDDRDNYELHIQDQHQGHRAKCPICHRMLKGKLKPHLDYIHTDGTAECYICRKEYSNKYKLMRHLKCHMDPKVPGAKVRCERCDETFESVAKLNYHKAKHQTKVFQCDKCSKMFYRQEALEQHQKVHDAKRDGQRRSRIDQSNFDYSSLHRKQMES